MARILGRQEEVATSRPAMLPWRSMTARRHVRHLAALRRAMAALSALAFLIVCSVDLVHESITNHVVCAEHGEITHAGAVGSGVADASAHDPVARGVPARERDHHEHCLLACTSRVSTADARPALGPVTVAEHRVATALPRTAAPPRGDLYRTAPKTSPPV